MSSAFTFEIEPQELEYLDPYHSGLSEGEAELSPAALTAAVAANRRLARQIGWGCVTGGQPRPIDALRALLGLAAGVGEEDFARAVETWQRAHLPQATADGQLGPGTWAAMRRAMVTAGTLNAASFKPTVWNVFSGGRKLGILEKTMSYREARQTDAAGAVVALGVEIELGFRVTDMDAVRRARFVDGAGEPSFRWIQTIELRRIGGGAANTAVQNLRRRANGFIIDPTSALLPLDTHPYYWYEAVPAGISAAMATRITRMLNRNFVRIPGRNQLCYDAIFQDAPRIPVTAAQPGRRAYFNFETALVGVRPGRQNVILNTALWGFDIIQEAAGPRLGVAPLRAGPTGGSAAMQRVLTTEIGAGTFPGHCFVGSSFGRGVRCA